MTSPISILTVLVICLHSVVAIHLPIVNLGYERHQASSLNVSGGFYNFSNIPFAEPPLGKLRFTAPIPPQGRSSTVNNGSIGAICPQAAPAWEAISVQFVPAYLAGLPFNLSAAEAEAAALSGDIPPQDPRTTEDCLTLDVFVPEKIFSKSTSGNSTGAPVMVWIYGGGYTTGFKDGSGLYNPAGLIKASQVGGSEGVIYVAPNYRLGAFGWLAGPTLSSNGTPNVALYDQRLALNWVQDNIHLFGGDPAKVTVFGESAGAGSIMHQITAFGGLNGPVPFTQAILQSPTWAPVVGNFQPENTFQSFLSLLNVSSIEEARQLPSEALITANALQVARSPLYGTSTYGPVVDGFFVPALPGRLLLQGSFHKNVKVMVGHNADEALEFTDPAVTNSTALTSFIKNLVPDISPSIVDYIDTVLYPPVFNGSYSYTTQYQRAVLVLEEAAFTCNTNYLDLAFDNGTYAYQWSVGAALHGSDVVYTFFNGQSPAILNNTVAIALQEYLTSFAQTGVPSGPGIPVFPLYGSDSRIVDFNTTRISTIMDPTQNARCHWWQKALFY